MGIFNRKGSRKKEWCMNWMTNTKAKIQAEINQERAIFHFLENAENAYVEVEYSLPFQTDGREYVFFSLLLL